MMDLTFLIPVKLDSSDRVRNITTVISYLLTNYDAKILVKEFDTKTKFKTLIIPQLEEKFSPEQLKNLEYFYEIQNKKYFHKTKVLNDLLETSTTKVVCNYDADVILPISSVKESYDMIISGHSDAVYPYGVGTYQKAVNYSKELYKSFINSNMSQNDVEKLNSNSTPSSSTIGWCQFIRRENYINSFMMNENFAAWGPEDCELFYRLNLLGNKVDRIDNYVYHLEHERTNDSWFSNPNWQENVQLWEWIRRQSRENLVEYYQKQEYIKRRKLNVSV